MSRPVSLFTDLDRTLIPNGDQEESPGVRAMLGTLVRRGLVEPVYVTGRDAALVRAAISEYGLPEPAAVIADVGTSIYEPGRGSWRVLPQWREHILRDFAGHPPARLAAALADLSDLRLQEPERQGPAKLSYYAPPDTDPAAVRAAVEARLASLGVRVRVVCSIGGTTGLVDVVPRSASKWHAIEYLLAERGIDRKRAIFAGDSGNDLEVFAAPLRSILVANAAPEVREEAIRLAEAAGHRETLYLARGGYLGGDGNYCGGILEGLAAAFPEIDEALREDSRCTRGRS